MQQLKGIMGVGMVWDEDGQERGIKARQDRDMVVREKYVDSLPSAQSPHPHRRWPSFVRLPQHPE